MKAKIEKGEFIELDRLLPRDGHKKFSEDGRLELMQHPDGSTYFVAAADRDRRINSVRRWEQAFRVYAAIYSRANPHRAAELWQYVYVINLAAVSYTWDNVSSYDYTFRQLMAQYLQRSWALIYNQMWNLAMRDPIGTTNRSGNMFMSNRNNGNSADRRQNSRDDYCWHFNKNRCKYGARCRYEHKCYYCDGSGHGTFNCQRKSGRRRSEDKREDRCPPSKDKK